MSKAVKSDGRVNALILKMCERGLGFYDRKDVNAILMDENALRQCEHGTLCFAFFSYERAFGLKNWHIQRHIEIKAWQSSCYRDFVGFKKPGAAPVELEAGDPLQELLERQKKDVA